MKVSRSLIQFRFGSDSELTALVDALHSKQLRFVLDMVVNHAGDGARIALEHPDWFHDPATCMTLGDPAVYCPYRRGINDFAQEKSAVAAYLDGVSVGWVRRFALAPLAEVSPGWKDPRSGRTVVELLKALQRSGLHGIADRRDRGGSLTLGQHQCADDATSAHRPG